MSGFLAELRRRNVIRMAGLYLVGAWLIVQVTGTILPMFEAPPWVARAVVLVLAVGFVPALVISWIFELTPGGLKREGEVPTAESIAPRTAQRMNHAIIALLLAALVYLGVDKFVLSPPGPAVPAVAKPATAPTAVPAIATDASIAVLPFVNMSSDPEQAYFADGLSEELLNQLAKVPKLRVIARTSSFSFKGDKVDIATIAKSLGVAYVLEGSVRRSGDTLRVTAQLIRASDSSHLWSETFDRPLVDVFRVQDEISAQVVSVLKLKLLPASGPSRPTDDIEAYNLYLLGREQHDSGSQDGYRQAIATYRKAIGKDPGFVRAWVGLSDSQLFLGDSSADSVLLQDAMDSVQHAYALAPDDADVLAQRSTIRFFNLDWRGAEEDMNRALALDPGNHSALARRAWQTAAQGRLPEALEQLDQAQSVDPLSLFKTLTRAIILNGMGRYEEAIAVLDPKLEGESGFSMPRLIRNKALVLDGRPAQALADVGEAGSNVALYTMALAGRSVGREAEAKAALARLETESALGFAYQIAELHAWRGDTDAAFAWLDRALAQRDGGIGMLRYDPALESLRGDPRYRALLERIAPPE